MIYIKADIFTNKSLLLLDGGMGTALLGQGCTNPVTLANIHHKELVSNIHKGFLEAGSNIIYTNTFGISRIKEEGALINPLDLAKSALEIATEAADRYDAIVAMSIGPTAQSRDCAEEAQLHHLYKTQGEVAREMGADMIAVETVMSLWEMDIAIKAIQSVCSLPMFCTLVIRDNLVAIDQSTLAQCAAALRSYGLAAAGINCVASDKCLQIATVFKDMLDLPMLVKANTGNPQKSSQYPISTKDWQRDMEALYHAGINILGGCCGTTPQHIGGLRASLR